ncbi:MAG: ABC transporter ATP-binding protein [Acidimicrobiia bacterium]|nr:ABC transporter ATP-binding protein [Acidimicrobiia bacterium]NNF69052.1 ABC transporter ATP-binding protein [Acidimicrobiia bacterium]NNK91825.1 ABC transporter ATP-binding protein [Acidimicrobiia bacterium]
MLSCHQVSARYNGTPVLDTVDIEVDPGEWVAVIGPNGAGKTTMLRVVSGALTFSGEVTIGGSSIAALPPRDLAGLVAVVPQAPVIPAGITVFDYVLLGRTPHIGYWSMEGRSDLREVGAVLERLELSHLADRPMDRVSGGERQRAVLGRALAQDAGLLLLDEPTSALDLGHQQQVLELVDSLRRDRGHAVLSAVHDLTLAAQFADRLVLLADGKVRATGTAEEVLKPDILARYYGADVTVVVDADGNQVVAPRRRNPVG